jgi:hypothetical protein
MSELFENLPIVSDQDELDKEKATHANWDQYYVACGCRQEYRDRLEELWPSFKPYADHHFLNELKTAFHQRAWEMYLGNIILKNFQLCPHRQTGPDFILENDNIYIECVVPTLGKTNNPDTVPQIVSNGKLIQITGEKFDCKTSQFTQVDDIEDKIILRITTSFSGKIEKYRQWGKEKWFDPTAPYIIAINIGHFQYPEDPKMPYVLKALFGTKYPQLSSNGLNYTIRRVATKSSSSTVPVDCFMSNKYSFISGVLFSNTPIFMYPDELGEDCLFINNPYAINPVPKNFSAYFRGWSAAVSGDEITLARVQR